MILAARSVMFSFLFTMVLCGQVLRIPASHTDRQTPGTFTVVMDAPQGKAPLALQWEFLIPPAIDVAIADIRIGKAAEAAGKNLMCAANSKTPAAERGMRYTCILAGGPTPIGNGPLAQVQYRAKADVGGAPVRIVMEHIVGASPDVQSIAIPSVSGIITIP